MKEDAGGKASEGKEKLVYTTAVLVATHCTKRRL